MEIGIAGNTCDIGEMAPDFEMSQELREPMTQVDGDAEEQLPMDDATVTAQVERGGGGSTVIFPKGLRREYTAVHRNGECAHEPINVEWACNFDSSYGVNSRG